MGRTFPQKARYSAAALLAFPSAGALASAAARADETTRHAALPNPVPRASAPAPPRLFPPTDGPEVRFFGRDVAGGRKLIAHGFRVLESPGGALEVSPDVLPSARGIEVVELPERLGGGYLFYTIASNTTLTWRAPTWAGRAEPLTQLDFEVLRYVPGFDRLYAVGKHASQWLALDAVNGRSLPLAALPAAPAYGEMAFVDAWFGAVEASFRGPLVTFDAGATFHPLNLDVRTLASAGPELEINTGDRRYLMDARGRIRAREARAIEIALAAGKGTDVADWSLAWPFDERPLRAAVLRGFRASPDSAIVARQGALARVRLRDGAVLALDPNAYAGGADCQAAPLGAGLGFICGDARSGTQIFAFEAPLRMREILRFEEPRWVGVSGNGALVLRGGCAARGAADANAVAQAYCVRFADGTLLPFSLERGAQDSKVIALRRGQVAVLSPPRAGAQGLLTLAAGKNGTERHALRSAKLPESTQQLLEAGTWLEPFQENGAGEVSGWVVGGRSFIGVRVSLSGELRVGRVESDPERLLASGAHALYLARGGALRETQDGGFSWFEAELPGEVNVSEARARVWQGCSSVGCAFGEWIRVGFQARAGTAELQHAETPTPLPQKMRATGRWSLSCAPTGEASEPALLDAARAPSSGVAPPAKPGAQPEPGSRPFKPFWEARAPRLLANEFGVDAGTEEDRVQVRAYLHGPRDENFARSAEFQIFAVDRFRARDGVWATAASPSPWLDDAVAAEIFGQRASGSPALFRAVLEPSGTAGVLLIHARGTVDLLLFEKQRPVWRVPNAARFQYTQLSIVRLDNLWYLGAYGQDRVFRILEVDGSSVRVVGEYRDVAPPFRNTPATLVRDTRRSSLAIWARAGGWYIFPVDRTTGQISAALTVEPERLSAAPRVCSGDEDGYVLEGPLPVEPFSDFEGQEGISAHGFEAEFVAGASGVCLESLAAQLDTSPTGRVSSAKSKTAPAVRSVPLVLSDRRPGGRRWDYRCGF